MTPTRRWTAGAVAVCLLLVIAAWFLVLSPQRANAADLRDQVSAQEDNNQAIALKTKQLEAQFASLPARQAQLAEIKQQMPDNPALPALIRDLSSNASAAGVNLVSVAPGTPAAVGQTTPGAVSAPGTAPASTSAALLQSIPTTLTVTGTYPELTLYLQKVQTTMRRAFLVQNIQVSAHASGSGGGAGTQAAGDGSTLQMTVMGDIFILGGNAASTAPAASAPTTPAS